MEEDRRHDTEATSKLLTELLGTPVTAKTLTNQRAAGRGLKGWEYLGTKPVIRESKVRHYAEHEALKSEPPRRRNARLASKTCPAP
jgi:hypothetical protein